MRYPYKEVDESFFRRESRAMYYMLGMFYGGCVPNGKDGVGFRSKHERLVEIVKAQLGSDHAIIPNTYGKNSYYLCFGAVEHLREALLGMGVKDDKKQRTCPTIDDAVYASHFARGFIEDKSHLWRLENPEGPSTRLGISFHGKFLPGLNLLLRKHAGVERDFGGVGNYIMYSYEDTQRIHDFIYGDWRYIKDSGLFLPSLKESFVLGYDPNKVVEQRKGESDMRTELAKCMLADNISPQEISEALGYASRGSFYCSFYIKVGKGVSKFQKKRAKTENK
jgi:hypothetical protein